MNRHDYPMIWLPKSGHWAPPLLTRPMLAELLNIDPGNIKRMLATIRENHPGVLRGIKVGHYVYYGLLDYLDLIEAMKEPGV